MKFLINSLLCILLCSLFVVPAYAQATGEPYVYPVVQTTNVNIDNRTINQVDKSFKNQYGFKVDAPNLVILSDNWSLGAEISKNVYHTDFEEGYAVYAKATYTGSLVDLRKK